MPHLGSESEMFFRRIKLNGESFMSTRYFKKMSENISASMNSREVSLINDEIERVFCFEIANLDDIYNQKADVAASLIAEIETIVGCIAMKSKPESGSYSWVEAINNLNDLGMIYSSTDSTIVHASNEANAIEFSERSNKSLLAYKAALSSAYDVYEDTLNVMALVQSIKRNILCDNVIPLLRQVSTLNISIESELSSDGYDNWSLDEIIARLELCLDELIWLEMHHGDISPLLARSLHMRLESNVLCAMDYIGRHLVFCAHKEKPESVREKEFVVYSIMDSIRSGMISNGLFNGDMLELIDALDILSELSPSGSEVCDGVDLPEPCDLGDTVDSVAPFSINGIGVLDEHLRVLCGGSDIDSLCDQLSFHLEYMDKSATGVCKCVITEAQVMESMALCLVEIRDLLRLDIGRLNTLIVGNTVFTKGMYKECLSTRCMYINLTSKIEDALDSFKVGCINEEDYEKDLIVDYERDLVVDVVDAILNL